MIEIEFDKNTGKIEGEKEWSRQIRNRSVLRSFITKARRKLQGSDIGNLSASQKSNYFLDEKHHNSYGRPWILGKYVFDYLIQNGISKDQKIIDFGCGAGRLGIWLIEFLEPENYFGVDSHKFSLDAFAEYEIPFHDLELKSPRLLCNDKFNFSYFNSKVDWVVEVFVSHHIPDALIPDIYSNVSSVLKEGGHYLTSPKPKIPNAELATKFGLEFVKKEP